MAKLIVKSGYIKPGGSKSAGGYLNYIGTRERVEILPDNRPPTRKQLYTNYISANFFPKLCWPLIILLKKHVRMELILLRLRLLKTGRESTE